MPSAEIAAEIAGEIVAHGPSVQGPPVGTRVFALAGTSGAGGYAQFGSRRRIIPPSPISIPLMRKRGQD